VVRVEWVVGLAQEFIRGGSVEDFAEPAVVANVAKIEIFDEVDEAGKVVEEIGEIMGDAVFLKKSVILHDCLITGRSSEWETQL